MKNQTPAKQKVMDLMMTLVHLMTLVFDNYISHPREQKPNTPL
jgi:uncharacterized short protein YbdD (DUF466 family)